MKYVEAEIYVAVGSNGRWSAGGPYEEGTPDFLGDFVDDPDTGQYPTVVKMYRVKVLLPVPSEDAEELPVSSVEEVDD